MAHLVTVSVLKDDSRNCRVCLLFARGLHSSDIAGILKDQRFFVKMLDLGFLKNWGLHTVIERALHGRDEILVESQALECN